jgi:hypothetical protein
MKDRIIVDSGAEKEIILVSLYLDFVIVQFKESPSVRFQSFGSKATQDSRY